MLYSCNDSIQNALINNVTGLFQLSKNSLLKVIESVVTRNANPNIPHIHSENITQSQDYMDLFIAYCPVFLLKGKFCQYLTKHIEREKMNFSRRALFYMKSNVCLKHFAHDCSFD